MADDNLFAGGEGGQQEGEGEGAGGAGAGLTAEQLSEQISAAVSAASGTNQTEIVEALNTLQGQVQQLQTAQQKGEEGDPPPANELFQKLYESPDQTIKDVAVPAAMEAIQSRLGPALRLQFEQTRDALVEQQKAALDTQYGEGFWEETISGDLAGAMEKMPLEMQASKDHITAAVAAIYGRKHLGEDRKAMDERRETVEKERAKPPAMLDGTRVRPRGTETSQEEKDFVSALQRSGIEYTMEQYLKARERGHTETDWRREATK